MRQWGQTSLGRDDTVGFHGNVYSFNYETVWPSFGLANRPNP
jgi:hypothetical protein